MSHSPAAFLRPAIILLLVVAVVIRLPGSVRAESGREFHRGIQRLMAEGQRAEALKELLKERERGTADFGRNNYDYLLGRLLEQEGRTDEAIPAYQRVVEKRSILSDHALWHLSVIVRGKGDGQAERERLQHLIKNYPQSLCTRDAQNRLSGNLFESKSWQEAIRAYRRLMTVSPGLKREALLRIATIQLELSRTSEAREGLGQLIAGSSIDDIALLASRALDALDAKEGHAPGELHRWERARVYQNNRAFEEARAHFRWMVDHLPSSRHRAAALYELGRGFYSQSRYGEAIPWFERAHDQFPKEREGEQGYYQAGHAHARAGRTKEAIARYEAFIRAYPDSEWLGGAFLNAIDVLRTAGNTLAALEWCDRTWTRFPGELAGVTALFSRARIHLAAAEYGAALEDLEKLSGQNLNRVGPSSPSRPEVTILKAMCLERLGRTEEAIDLYLSLREDRQNFYGQRATLRLRALRTNDAAAKSLNRRFEEYRRRVESSTAPAAHLTAKDAAHQALRIAPDERSTNAIKKRLSGIYLRIPNYQRVLSFHFQSWERQWLPEGKPAFQGESFAGLGRELLFLGLYDEGARAWNAHYNGIAANRQGKKRPIPLKDLFTLAALLHRGGDGYGTLQIGENYFAGLIPTDIRLELLPADVAHLLYPVAYRDEMATEGLKAGVDPRFVLSIARQESRFRADAKSAVGARGLLQFIPETSTRLALQLKVPSFSEESLYQPLMAIRMGVAYIRELDDRVGESLFAVAAAYNGGEEGVDRWRDRTKTADDDRFLSEVGFRETKDYVRRVMTNYWAYQRIVDEELRPF